MKYTQIALILIIAGLLMISPLPLLAGDTSPTEPDQDVGQNTTQLWENETTCDIITHKVDLWHDACLKADEEKINDCESQLMVDLAEDIKTDRILFGLLVRQAITENVERMDGINQIGNPDVEAVPVLDIQAIAEYAGMISTKEELYRSISASDCFASKYRLLGDYVSLLRKELGMPKPKFAFEEGMMKTSGPGSPEATANGIQSAGTSK